MWAEIDLEKKSVKRVVNGDRPRNSLPIVDNSTYPTGPDIFKGQPTYSYVINVAQWLDDVEDKAAWSFAESDYVEQVAVQDMMSVEQCKNILYQLQKEKRQKMQLGSFLVGELPVTLKDREDSLIISSLPEADTRYKLGQGNWITLSATQVSALKEAHRLHVQAAYDWEMNANAEVDALTTLDELTAYLDSL